MSYVKLSTMSLADVLTLWDPFQTPDAISKLPMSVMFQWECDYESL